MEKTSSADAFEGEVVNERFLKCMRDAGALALEVRQKGLSAEVKSSKEDIVTEGDRTISLLLQKQLTELFPGIEFIDEEDAGSDKSAIPARSMVAIIDPIDGTSNYYNNGVAESATPANPNWGISVGIVKNGEICGGAICQPSLQKLFYAEKDRGAYVNGKRLATSTTKSFADARMTYDYPYPKDEREYDLTARVLERLHTSILSAEKLGSQVIEAMEVAQGKSDFFLHLKTKPWDVAAAVAIVTEAGGKALNITGEPFRIADQSIILTNGAIDTSSLIHIINQELERDQ